MTNALNSLYSNLSPLHQSLTLVAVAVVVIVVIALISTMLKLQSNSAKLNRKEYERTYKRLSK